MWARSSQRTTDPKRHRTGKELVHAPRAIKCGAVRARLLPWSSLPFRLAPQWAREAEAAQARPARSALREYPDSMMMGQASNI
jgi:hypothetical protein